MDTAEDNESSASPTTMNNSTENVTSLTMKHQPSSWTCSGDKLKDDLKLFTTGSFYDCTFKVSNEVTNESKLYRCHKVFLASSSEVFEKMLFGSFKEATADQDYEICITKTSPDVFDLAMRFVYGRAVDFKTPHQAVQVYLFGREWMILHLMKAVENFLETIRPEDALKILEHFVDEENYISSKCLEVIQKSTEQVLSDMSWLEAPEEVVLEVLDMDSMQINEATLFEYLLKWGLAQVKDKAELRAKIDKCIKLIRFCTMDSTDFSTKCCKSIALNVEEKYKIFLCLTQKNAKFLPEGFSKEKTARCQGLSYLYSWKTLKTSIVTVNNEMEPVILNFSIESTSCPNLTGLILHSLTDINAGEEVDLTCEVYSSEHPSLCLTSATFGRIIPAKNSGELYFPWPVLMRPGIPFTVKLTYKHTNKLSTVAFFNAKTYTWCNDNPNEKVTVMFAGNIKRIVDICGLILAKKVM